MAIGMKPTNNLLLINGPNLNLLGSREPDIYGHESLAAIEQRLVKEAAKMKHELDCFQSNHEGELIERIQRAGEEGIAGIIINPGAFTHTSVALRDALLGAAIPFIEIHLSNLAARESFRHRSYMSDIASGVILGLGTRGYSLALMAMHDLLTQR